MARLSVRIWLDTPPNGSGVQLTKVRPFGALPWNVWSGGVIVRFCASVDEAFAALRYETGG